VRLDGALNCRDRPRWLISPVAVSKRRARGCSSAGLGSEVVNIETAQDPPAPPN
jgi:hypothetical protein